MSRIHIQVWDGSQNARITDMTDAYKRGKVCRALRVLGVGWSHHASLNDIQRSAKRWSDELLYNVRALQANEATSFDDAREGLISLVNLARSHGVPDGYLSVNDETIKAISAPRVELNAGVPGKWSARADSSGISLRQLDDVNEWSEITHRQTAARAYEIAAKVWPQVQAASTLRTAAEILRLAGARLHGYCGLD